MSRRRHRIELQRLVAELKNELTIEIHETIALELSKLELTASAITGSRADETSTTMAPTPQ